MTQVAMNEDNPADFVEQWRDEIMASLQNLNRPFDEQSDEIWSEATEALNNLFAETRKRVENL